MRNFNQEYKVEVYTASYCGWCSKTKEILKENGIIYDEKLLDDGAFLQKNSHYKDVLTLTQNEKLNEFNMKITQLYFDPANKAEENSIHTFFADAIAKNNEDFLSVIKNIEISEENSIFNEVADYLSNHLNLVEVYNDFYNFKVEVINNQNEFFAHMEKGEINMTIPQIFVNGEIFPNIYNPEVDQSIGTYGQLNNCVEIYGDVNSCFLEFLNNREQFNEAMFPSLPEVEEINSKVFEIQIIDSAIGVAA
jgi:glutaredoxin